MATSTTTETEKDYGDKYYVPIEYENEYGKTSFTIRVYVKDDEPYKFKLDFNFRDAFFRMLCRVEHEETRNKIRSLKNAVMSVFEMKQELTPLFVLENKKCFEKFEQITDDFLSRSYIKEQVNKRIKSQPEEINDFGKKLEEFRLACEVFSGDMHIFYNLNGSKKLRAQLSKFPRSHYDYISEFMKEKTKK